MKNFLLLLLPVSVTAFIFLVQGDYVGASGNFPACVNCHGDAKIAQTLDRFVFEEWKATAHGTAYDSIGSAVVQNSARCITCHTTGFDSTLANNGADDYISWTNYTSGVFNVSFDDSVGFGMKTNVQCESCHGPASEHATNPSNKPPVILGADVCGTCHQDVHHPYLEEWQMSKHAISNTNASAFLQNSFRNSPDCSGCHTMQGFIEFVGETQADTVNMIPAVTGNYGDASLPIVCATCHDPHPAIQHEGQLRLEPAALCVKCHNPEEAEPGEAVHHATSSMFAGMGAVQFAGYTYRTQSVHQLVEPTASRKCVTCHVYRTEGDFSDPNNPIPTAVGHTFNPRIEACGQSGCHEAGLGEVGPRGPFDYKRRQTYTDSLSMVLRGLLENVSPADSTTQTFAEAVFNLEFVESSGSHGVHNAWYAEDILKATIEVSRANFTIVAVEPVPGAEVPKAYSLYQNYPNPFNPSTVIEFEVPTLSHVRLEVYNAIGQHVATLADRQMEPNRYRVDFDANNLPSGLYFYTLEAGETSLTRKMLLVR